MSTQSKPLLTPEQYLEIERKAEFKSEYYQGEMFAMSGGKVAHIRIVANIMRELGTQLTDRTCEPLSNDMRVCVKPTGVYTYPDVVVVCGEPQFLDDTLDTLLNPKVIIEILSDSTGSPTIVARSSNCTGRSNRWQKYVLISSRGVSVERLHPGSRTAPGSIARKAL